MCLFKHLSEMQPNANMNQLDVFLDAIRNDYGFCSVDFV